MDKFFISSFKIFLWIFIGGIAKLIFSNTKLYKTEHFLQVVSKIIVFYIVPVIIGIKIWNSNFDYNFVLFSTILFAILMVVSYIISRFLTSKTGFSFKEVYLPLTFMNTIYLGIPVTEYFVSPEMVPYTIMYAIIVTIVHFIAGTYILTQKIGVFINFILKSSIIYAFLSGWILNRYNIPVPYTVLSIHNLFSKFLSPIMLIYMGYTFPWKNFLDNIRIHVVTNIVRITIFFIVSILFCIILKNFVVLQKNVIKVLVLVSILPSAIINYILAERFNIDTKFICGEIFWGTGITIFLLPYLSELLEIILITIY